MWLPSAGSRRQPRYETSTRTLLHNFDDILVTRDTLLNAVVLAEQTIDEVTEFMKALTDPAARDLSAIAPARVPSGLPVDRP
jgi:hypothetical protein